MLCIERLSWLPNERIVHPCRCCNNKLQVVGEAVFQAAVMAIKEKAPTLLPGININFTCINSKCVDIPTYNAVYDLAEQGAGAHM
jgi:hypothetical protein